MFQRIFLSPDGEALLSWLRMVCRVSDRTPGLVGKDPNPLVLAQKEALRALYNEILFMVKGA